MDILKPLPGTLPMPGRPLADALGHWPFNSLGDEVYDLSGNRNRIDFFFGNPAWSAGWFGHAIELDGNDYLRLTNSNDFLFGTGDSWSIIAYVNVNAFGTNRNIVRLDKGTTVPGRHLWLLRYSTTNRLEVVFGNTAGTLHVSASPRAITTAGLHQVAAVVNAVEDRVHLYIDGVEEINAVDVSTAWSTTPDELYFGVYGGDAGVGTPKEFFPGLIEHVTIYNYALRSSGVALRPFYMFPEPIMPEFGIAV